MPGKPPSDPKNPPATPSVEQTARLLGIGRSAAYAAVRAGTIPTIRFGRKLLVPTQALMRTLGMEPTPTPRAPRPPTGHLAGLERQIAAVRGSLGAATRMLLEVEKALRSGRVSQAPQHPRGRRVSTVPAHDALAARPAGRIRLLSPWEPHPLRATGA